MSAASDPAVEGSPFITAEDMEHLNRREVLRLARVGRRLSTVVLGLVVAMLLAETWDFLRFQQFLTDSGRFPEPNLSFDDSVPWAQRVDGLSRTITQLWGPALLTMVAVGLRLGCDWLTLREGGDVTPWRVGDPIEPDDEETTS